MTEIRYTRNGNYDPHNNQLNSAGSEFSSIRPSGDNFILVLSDGETFTLDINPHSDGISADFSGETHSVFIAGGERGDVLIGGSLGDKLIGGAGDDMISGGKGDSIDRLFGGSGSDQLFGGGGSDRISGGRGADLLEGGIGADKLTGGSGADTFSFERTGEFSRNELDHITDFSGSSGEGDKIDLTAIGDFILVARFDAVGTAELMTTQQHGHAILSGDADGDGKADFSVRVDTAAALTQADFTVVPPGAHQINAEFHPEAVWGAQPAFAGGMHAMEHLAIA